MAQDSGSQNTQAHQEIDLDELEVVILIIGKNASSLNQSAAFLTRRGWPTTVMTNMSKAVEHIAEKKPDFVLVSFNHPNPAVMKLPDLITQTFNLSCVGFVENMDASSQSKLNGFKMRHKIQGMPSGPNLQRSIRKILAEKFNIKTDEGQKAESARERGTVGDNSLVTVKGGTKAGGAADGGTLVQSSGHGPGSQKGAQMVKGEPGLVPGSHAGGRTRLSEISAQAGDNGHGSERGSNLDHDGEETESVSTGKYTMSKKVRKSLKDLKAAGEGPSGEIHKDPEISSEPSAKSGQLADMLKRSLFGENGHDNTDEPATDDPAAATGGAVAAQAASQAGKLSAAQAKQKEVEEAAAQRNATDAYYANSKDKSGSSSGPSFSGQDFPSAYGKADPLSQLVEMTPEQVAALPAPKLLERAVASAMHRVCQRTPDTITRELGMLTKVAVFPIDSSTLPGYLVLGMEQDPERIEDFFLKACESRLREEFGAMKVPASIESGFWVHVPDVRFTWWVAEKAEFKLVLPHEESEVGVGFFPVAGGVPRAKPNAENKEMLKVSLDDISTDQPINFKAYLHLKKNQKYFLYLRNGRQLQPEQKKRLKGRKVEDIYMKSIEAENLRMFLAASFLRETIKKAS